MQQLNSTETVDLSEGDELKKPYQAKAHELVNIVCNSASQITL
ncbi:hypothetical protein OAE92_00260 [Akkermansiaceae bacterium]|nr:hypothetical protein [Akkermansiaceae bacterium]